MINTTGAVTFNGGKQTANGANALRIAGGAGAINATVAGAATTGVGTAVNITGTGPLTFANTGAITTTGATSTGINISGVTTASVNCGNVSTTGAGSPAVVVAANGTTNVTCGTVSTTGASSDAIMVSNTAGTTTVTGGTTSVNGTSIWTEGHNYGAYAQFGMTTGLYIGALVKRDDYRTLLTNGGFQNGYANPRSHSTGAEGEIGFRTGGMGNINFDLGAGFAYVKTHMDTFSFGNIGVSENKMTSERGQAHIRATYASSLAPFIEVRGFHEFRDNNSYFLNSGLGNTTLDGSNKGTWARIEAGIGGGTKGGPLISAWANVGDTTGFGLRAGFRF